MNKQFNLILLFLIFAMPGLLAQRSKMRKANNFLETQRYDRAIEMYENILEKKDVAEAKINLAEAYRQVKNYERAEYWYSSVVKLAESEPIHKYYYGLMLQRNGQCERAIDWYRKYLEEKPSDRRAKQLLNACDYQKELMTKNKDIYDVQELSINSIYNDLGPAYYYNGIVFASERTKGANQGRKSSNTYSYLDLYYTEVRHFEGETCGTFNYGIPVKFSSRLNSRLHEAIVTFNEDESEIFYTQNTVRKSSGKGEDLDIFNLKIMHSKSLGDGRWQNVQPLPFNSYDYSVAHPSLTPDGKFLFFSSNMSGGYGGYDIYVAERIGERWGPPLNLGPEVNSSGDEEFPYFEKGGRLYFSSDGLVGLGGKDIFYAEQLENGKWGKVQNMGFPINSYYDDFGIIFSNDGFCGYFTSDREMGTGGNDIYAFYKNSVMLQLFVHDQDNGEALEGAKIYNECTKLVLETLEDGKLALDLQPGECCKLTTYIDGYLPRTTEVCTNDASIGDTTTALITLEKEKDFEVSGYVFDQSTGRPIEGAVVKLTNMNCLLPEPVITDVAGRYFFKLDRNCCYGIEAEKGDFFKKELNDILCTKGDNAEEEMTLDIFLQPFSISGLENKNTQYTEALEKPGKKGDYTASMEAANRKTIKRPRRRTSGVYPFDSVPQGDYSDEEEETPLTVETTLRGNIKDFEKTVSTSEAKAKSEAYLLKIYYDFGDARIRKNDVPELKKLLKLIRQNPDAVIEIGSHTDSRGDDDFNENLSQKRAEGVVNWLVGNGINAKRLQAKGYGENQPVNDCTNYVNCPEEDHQLNRRTEFKVVGKMN
jgi:outer membrane protein OmpA-like peptidoglycan-associated protein/tetratricopeptide (TPR) repeat protein